MLKWHIFHRHIKDLYSYIKHKTYGSSVFQLGLCESHLAENRKLDFGATHGMYCTNGSKNCGKIPTEEWKANAYDVWQDGGWFHS